MSCYPKARSPSTRWCGCATALSSPSIEECVRRVAGAGHLNSFLWFDPERALTAARLAPLGPLRGVAVAVKDNIDVAGIPTTSGSLVDRDLVAVRDAGAWARLHAAGATFLGKTHMSEFAYGPTHPALGPVRHPLDPARDPGTSSSGSAAAVAAELCPVALGTDTGGSVRVPAAYCGLVGLKGTHGLVPVEGVMPLAPSLDDVGVLARTVGEAFVVLEVLAGVSFDVAGERVLRVGVDSQFLRGCSPAVASAFERACAVLLERACVLREVRLPDLARMHVAHRTVLHFEAHGVHASRLARGAIYGPAFAAALRRGALISEERYLEGKRRQGRVAASLGRLLSEEVDVLLTPTAPTVAPLLGSRRGRHTRYTFLANFAGLPAVSVPAGRDQGGWPVGLQVIAGSAREAVLLRAAALVESGLA